MIYIDVNIEYKGVELRVYGQYTPPTPMSLGDDDMGHIGSPAEFEVEGIEHNGDCFYDLLENQIPSIAEEVIDQYQQHKKEMYG